MTKPKVHQDPHWASLVQNHRCAQIRTRNKSGITKGQVQSPRRSCLQLFWGEGKDRMFFRHSSHHGAATPLAAMKPAPYSARTGGCQFLPPQNQDLQNYLSGRNCAKRHIPLTGDEEKQTDFVISVFFPLASASRTRACQTGITATIFWLVVLHPLSN